MNQQDSTAGRLPEQCPQCGMWHQGIRCPLPPPYQYVVHPGGVAGHCGKCGAPYTWHPISGGTTDEYQPTCRCWNR